LADLRGMVFPQMVIDLLPRLERFDVDFDIPDAFLPEFPPAIFLQERPELGDVSRGEVVTADNIDRLFRGILTPMELDGLRLLVTPFAQEEFNLSDDRKSPHPTLGVACFDCHVNGHTTGQIELGPQILPQQRRLRLDTPSLRGMYAQLIHGSKRSIRSVRDFSRFEENRAAYFNGDQMHADKKGAMILAAEQSVEMERMQNMFDWPPAPKLDLLGHLDPAQATQRELHGQALFFGKAQCGACHPAPFYLDNSMDDAYGAFHLGSR
jgi:cytochrome c peroxidase